MTSSDSPAAGLKCIQGGLGFGFPFDWKNIYLNGVFTQFKEIIFVQLPSTFFKDAL